MSGYVGVTIRCVCGWEYSASTGERGPSIKLVMRAMDDHVLRNADSDSPHGQAASWEATK